jgi:hypothetical protein
MTTDERPPNAIDLQTSRDLLHKLEREIERIRSSTTREDVADHAFNAIVTAWHIRDWAARDIAETRRELQSQDGPADYTGDLPANGQKLGELVIAECPDLEMCQSFANVSKHAKRNQWTIDAHFVPGDTANGKYQPLIIDRRQCTTHDVVDVLRRVHRFWEQFLYGHGIG